MAHPRSFIASGGGGPAPRASSLQIDTLRVRLAAPDAAAGRRFAADLAAALAQQLPPLLARGAVAATPLETLRLELRSTSPKPDASGVAAGVARSVARLTLPSPGKRSR